MLRINICFIWVRPAFDGSNLEFWSYLKNKCESKLKCRPDDQQLAWLSRKSSCENRNAVRKTHCDSTSWRLQPWMKRFDFFCLAFWTQKNNVDFFCFCPFFLSLFFSVFLSSYLVIGKWLFFDDADILKKYIKYLSCGESCLAYKLSKSLAPNIRIKDILL